MILHETAKGMKSDHTREEKLLPVGRMVCSASGDPGADCAPDDLRADGSGRCTVRHGIHSSIQTDQIESAQSYDCIDNSGKPAEISKKECNQVKSKDTDQEPVCRTDDDKSQGSIVEPLHAISSFSLSLLSLLTI